MSATNEEYLTFKLGKEEFAISIDRVQEIRSWQVPSPLPNVPKFVKGVVDLRGTVVPILDLRDRFNIPASYNATTVVIVVNIDTTQGERVTGLVVDAVSDVHQFDSNAFQPPPDISSSMDNQFMTGLTTIKSQHNNNDGGESSSKNSSGQMVIVIDIDKLASEGLIEQVTSTDEAIPLRNG